MTQDSIIHFIRLVKKLYNDQQKAIDDGISYISMLAHYDPLASKVDAQLKLINNTQEPFYDWLPRFVRLTREWRRMQIMYKETAYESKLMNCREFDRMMGEGFKHIKQNTTNVLENPNTQTKLAF